MVSALAFDSTITSGFATLAPVLLGMRRGVSGARRSHEPTSVVAGAGPRAYRRRDCGGSMSGRLSTPVHRSQHTERAGTEPRAPGRAVYPAPSCTCSRRFSRSASIPRTILNYLSPYGEIGLMLIIFAETGLLVGFFLPGDSLLFTAGMLANQGKLEPGRGPRSAASRPPCIGDQVGLHDRRQARARASSPSPIPSLFKREYVERTEAFFDKHGPKTIVLARFVPVVRTFAPVLAGVGKMSRRTFLTYNVIGAFIWVFGVTHGRLRCSPTSIGDSVDKYLLPIIFVIIVVSLIPPFLEWRKAKKAGPAPDQRRPGRSRGRPPPQRPRRRLTPNELASRARQYGASRRKFVACHGKSLGTYVCPWRSTESSLTSPRRTTASSPAGTSISWASREASVGADSRTGPGSGSTTVPSASRVLLSPLEENSWPRAGRVATEPWRRTAPRRRCGPYRAEATQSPRSPALGGAAPVTRG